jgi:two-component system, NtrC family, nitrogen regulation sensor histidine kinase NtrY
VRRIPLEWRIAALALAGAAPAVALGILVYFLSLPDSLLWSGIAVALIWPIVVSVYTARRLTHAFERVSGLVHSVREGEYGLRARREAGSYGHALAAVNLLGSELAGMQRAGIESDALLGKLLSTLDLAILVFDPTKRLTSANTAGLQLLGGGDTELMGHLARDLGLEDWLETTAPHRESRHFPGGEGPWEVRMARFRRSGRAYSLLVITDLSQALREEERRAWRGLIRVLAHEASNSLGPIQSAADTLNRSLLRHPGVNRLQEELASGLALIERRARYLSEFIRRYADLARLPPPRFEVVDLGELLQRLATLETRVPVHTQGPEHLPVKADPAQLEQALINLVKNAADATLETGGGIDLHWRRNEARIEIEIRDEGAGLPDSENLFVPFFTTKPGGSGIGLVLARQIIEAHGGTLVLANREDSHGAVARLRLPGATP